jgi:hypothetical protein
VRRARDCEDDDARQGYCVETKAPLH